MVGKYEYFGGTARPVSSDVRPCNNRACMSTSDQSKLDSILIRIQAIAERCDDISVLKPTQYSDLVSQLPDDMTNDAKIRFMQNVFMATSQSLQLWLVILSPMIMLAIACWLYSFSLFSPYWAILPIIAACSIFLLGAKYHRHCMNNIFQLRLKEHLQNSKMA